MEISCTEQKKEDKCNMTGSRTGNKTGNKTDMTSSHPCSMFGSVLVWTSLIGLLDQSDSMSTLPQNNPPQDYKVTRDNPY